MKTKPVGRIAIILLVLGLGAYIWLDPGHPTPTDASTAVERLYRDGEKVLTTSVGRSFVGRRLHDTQKSRVWPVRLTVQSGEAQMERPYFVWKDSGGNWQAEPDDLLGARWTDLGFFGILGK